MTSERYPIVLKFTWIDSEKTEIEKLKLVRGTMKPVKSLSTIVEPSEDALLLPLSVMVGVANTGKSCWTTGIAAAQNQGVTYHTFYKIQK